MKTLVLPLLFCFVQVWSQDDLAPIYIYPEGNKVIFMDVYGQKRVIDEVQLSQHYEVGSPSSEYAHALSIDAIKKGQSYHVSYTNTDAIYHLYSHDDGRTWKKEKVDDIANYSLQMYDYYTGEHQGPTTGKTWLGTLSGTHLAIDSKGQPHIAYTVSGGNYHYDCYAIYACRKNGRWQPQKISTAKGYPKKYLGYVDLEINDKGIPYIVIHSHEKVNTRKHSLSLFTLRNKKWKRQIITYSNTGSPSMNIKIDSNKHLHVLTTISSDSVFYWVSKDDGKTWNEQYLLTGNCRCDMELDSKNQPQMACACYNNGIYYGIKQGNSWAVKKLETRNQMCHTGLAINANDKVYVSFYTEYHHPCDVKLYTLSNKHTWDFEIPLQVAGKRGSSWYPAVLFDVKKDMKIDSIVLEPVDNSQIQPSFVVDENRPTEDLHYIVSTTKEISISIIDHAKEDNDSIAIKVNDQWILENHKLTKKPKEITFTLEEGKINTLVLYALNEGNIPPNTATLIIRYGVSTIQLKMTSNLQLSGTLRIKYVNSE